jgi:subtilisin
MSERKYIVLPLRGFKSREMEEFAPKSGKASKRKASGVSKFSMRPLEGGPSISINIVDSISRDGPKAAEMSTLEAQEFRRLARFRLVPVRKYRPARRPITSISLKALSRLVQGRQRTQLRVFLKEAGTDRPLADVVLIAIVDGTSGAGLRRRTGASGQATLTFPHDRPIEQLSVYPPPGYWGKYLENPKLSDGYEIFLTRVEPRYPDLLRQTFRTPRTGSGSRVRVAVIDTGVYRSHPALNVAKAYNCVSSESQDDLDPSDGHGTHVAGIIAGRDHGIAPEVELYSYKVFPHSGPAENLDIARAIDRAVEDRCDLINLSLGGGQPDALLSEAIGHAFEHGTVCVAAAGNARRRPVAYPAWFKRSLAVSAIGKIGSFPVDAIEAGDISSDRSSLDRDLFFASFSNYGREIDLCAPGVGIVSTWTDGGYAVESGTSMVCPIVTGIGAALLSADQRLLSKNRSITRSLEIVQRIQGCSQSVGLDQTFEGFGQPSIR